MDEDKKIVDCSLNDLKEVIEIIKINTDFEEKEIGIYLGVSIEGLSSIHQEYPKFKLSTICYFLPQLLEQEGFKVEKLIRVTPYNGIKSVKKKLVEIDLDKEIEVVTDANYFLVKDNKKFVVCINFEGYMEFTGVVGIYSTEENKKIGSEIIKKLNSYIQVHNFLKGKKITPFGKFLKVKSHDWNDIILSSKLKNEITRNIEKYLTNFKLYKENGLPTKRGILITGIPGVGKTLLGKVLVSTIKDVTFIWATPKYLLSGREGIDMLFDLATETAPTILFLEDVDFYGTGRNQGNNSYVLGEFLNKVDGLIENEGVLIIMTTNYPELLDEAIKERPGRFDRIIKMELPKKEERRKMLSRFCKDLKVNDKIDWEKIVEQTDKFTPALLKELVITACSFGIDANSVENNKVILKQKHFDLALDALKNYTKVDPTKKPLGFSKDKEFREEDEKEFYSGEEPGPAAADFTYENDTGEIK